MSAQPVDVSRPVQDRSRDKAMYVAWRKQRTLKIMHGTWAPFTDPAPAREHIIGLLQAGMSIHTVAKAAGLSRVTIMQILHLDHPRAPAQIRTSTHKKIIAVSAYVPLPARCDLHGRFSVPAIGARRRIQALRALGWRLADLSAATGLTRDGLSRISTGSTPTVQTSTDRAVRNAYRHLGRREGPCERSRIWAAKHGWASPAAWDDIDNPHASPVACAALLASVAGGTTPTGVASDSPAGSNLGTPEESQ